jgi:regulator of sigma E protease
MSIFFGILLTLVVLLIVVMIHEFGHFITARLTGMKVEEFGIGIPPHARSLFTDKKWTEYTLNWLPIGWFVRILGEDASGKISKNKWSFITKPWISRVIVLAAWVTMNFFLAFIIFTGLFLYGIAPMTVIPMEGIHSQILPSTHEAIESGYISHQGITLNPVKGSIAEKAGTLSGDIIYSINWIIPKTSQDIIDIIKKNTELKIVVWGDSPRILLMNPKDWKVGMSIGYKELKFNDNKVIKYAWYEAIIMGWRETIATTRLTLEFLSRMVVGIFIPKNEKEHEDAKNMLSGPIWLGSTFVSIVENNVPITIILVMIALLSINLGVINILPFPALDGGRIVTTTLYSLFSYIPNWKIIFSKTEWIIHTMWFIILLIFMIYVSGLDVLRFF